MSASELEALRAEVDALDRELVAVLARRRDVVRRIAEVKRGAGLPAFDPAREEAVRAAMRTAAAELGVPRPTADALAAVVLDDGRAEVAAALGGRRG